MPIEVAVVRSCTGNQRTETRGGAAINIPLVPPSINPPSHINLHKINTYSMQKKTIHQHPHHFPCLLLAESFHFICYNGEKTCIAKKSKVEEENRQL